MSDVHRILKDLKDRFSYLEDGMARGLSPHDFAYAVGYRDAVREVFGILVAVSEGGTPFQEAMPDVFSSQSRISADEYARSPSAPRT